MATQIDYSPRFCAFVDILRIFNSDIRFAARALSRHSVADAVAEGTHQPYRGDNERFKGSGFRAQPPAKEWKHEPYTLNMWGPAIMRS